ncbi:MAG: hypothetical protein RLZZ501_1691, partial [Pseudomonadota bacterium]
NEGFGELCSPSGPAGGSPPNLLAQ